MSEVLDLQIRSNASASELFAGWRQISDLADQTAEAMERNHNTWRHSTDPLTRQQGQIDYEANAREYRVLRSWAEVFFAAYIFSTDGAECAALGSSSMS